MTIETQINTAIETAKALSFVSYVDAEIEAGDYASITVGLEGSEDEMEANLETLLTLFPVDGDRDVIRHFDEGGVEITYSL